MLYNPRKPSAYARFWTSLGQPLFERLRGKAIQPISDTLATSQYWDRRRMAQWQTAELAALLTHAGLTVPYFRDWFSGQGLDPKRDAASLALTDLPLLERGQVIADPVALQSEQRPEGTFAKATGGTTGEPVRFVVDPRSDWWRVACTRRGYSWAGALNGARQLHLWSGDVTRLPAAFRLKRFLNRKVFRIAYTSNFQLGPDELDRVLELIDSYKPRVIVSFASSVEVLALHARERGWKPRRPLEAAITGAEPLFEARRQNIESGLGCPVFNTYGNREFMLIGMECPEFNGLHVSAENLIVELLLPDGTPAPPGAQGEVVITDLHNYAQPFIRYRTGDLASWAQGDCPCGRTLPRLAGIEGRLLDAITRVDGRLLTGGFFPHLFKEFPAVRQFQVEQVDRARIIMRLVLGRPLEDGERAHILEKTAEALPGTEVDMQVVEAIPRSRLGKVRVTIGLDPQA